jgi:hypothetical protein
MQARFRRFAVAALLLASPAAADHDGTPQKDAAGAKSPWETGTWSRPATRAGWTAYGAPVTKGKKTKLAKTTAAPASGELIVEASVAEVCQSKGCWMTVADGAEKLRVEFRDYGFFVPRTAAGKRVRMQGTVEEKTISPEAARHIAGESSSPDAGLQAATAPQTLRVFVASAVEIQGGGPVPEDQRRVIEGKPAAAGHEGHDHH